ncbi:hypothetical protein Tco_1325759, partial [Tanacetum coccineum]
MVNHRQTTGQRWSTTVNGGRAPLTIVGPPLEQCSVKVAGGHVAATWHHVAADVVADVDNQAWEGLERLTS